jgi:hypothetical protein
MIPGRKHSIQLGGAGAPREPGDDVHAMPVKRGNLRSQCRWLKDLIGLTIDGREAAKGDVVENEDSILPNPVPGRVKAMGFKGESMRERGRHGGVVSPAGLAMWCRIRRGRGSSYSKLQ